MTRLLAALLASALLFGTTTACEDDDEQSLLATAEQAEHAQLRTEAQQLLDRRARALRSGDRRRFLSTIDRTDRGLVARQERYFDNIARLPIDKLGFEVTEKDWPSVLARPRWGEDVYLPQVLTRTQLTGYDSRPVQRLTGFAFQRVADRLVIVGDRTRADMPFPGTEPPPWELTRIHVVDSGTVLGLYDDSTVPSAHLVNDIVQDGIYDVTSALPFPWTGRVVVYYFDDPAVLRSIPDVPGGKIEQLGALTFPVYAQIGKGTLAGARFVLLRTSVDAGQPFLGRIVRHELSHVAIARRDDGAPTWFAEGLAEYLGARELVPSERRIPRAALVRANGGVHGLPPSGAFNGADQEWNYALSWMAIDYLAESRGEASLWVLMRALNDGGHGTVDADQDAVLLSTVGLTGDQLARRAANRILRNYG